jgi:uncharacterized protein YhaN
LGEVERSSEDLAGELVRGYERERKIRETRERLGAELAGLRADRERAARTHAEAETVLVELVKTAHVGSADELEAAERRWHERALLERELYAEEQRLFEAGEGAGIGDLEALTRDLDVDRAKARLEELALEHQRLDEEIDELNRRIGGGRAGLEAIESKEGAFGAAADVQGTLATIRRLSERYVRTRLAVRLLEREIERYREENQGPIVARASELFPRLTLGRYRQLTVDYHADEPELRCVRGDGREVGVDALSDGTRDQLYLALRLASLERHAQKSELLPVVLDDILIHFDDDRSRAALGILNELCQTTQVLFFTHHERLLELAREVIPSGRRREHRLGSTRRTQLELRHLGAG